jgi:hypothetical protein
LTPTTGQSFTSPPPQEDFEVLKDDELATISAGSGTQRFAVMLLHARLACIGLNAMPHQVSDIESGDDRRYDSRVSSTDIDAVLARRDELAQAAATLQQKRAELTVEDEELALTERVLHRLSSYGAAAPERPAEATKIQSPLTQTVGALSSLLRMRPVFRLR